VEPIEIVCESCESRMRLSESLLGKILGKSGRVTCRECESKIVLDATRGQVRVTQGGRLVTELEIEELLDFTEAPPSVDPHLSELPLVPVSSPTMKGSSVPPPLPVEARAPSMRASNSLSPLTLGDDEDDGLVPLGREFNSSPFASERDQSYNSLFPRPERKAAPLELEAPLPSMSRIPVASPTSAASRLKNEPDLFSDEISTAPAVASTLVEMGPDGQLINQADKKLGRAETARARSWVPWTVAAISLLGLGVSVSLNRPSHVVIQAPEPSAAANTAKASVTEKRETGEAKAGAAPTEGAPVPGAPVEAAVIDAREVSVVAALPQASPAASSSKETGAALTEGAASFATLKEAEARESAPLDADAPLDEKTRVDAKAERSSEGATSDDEAEKPVLSPFSATAAASAFREATALAGACRKPGDPSGLAKVVVTFAPSGRVTRASVTGAPFAGTETGGCIAARFRTARVPAFSGEHVTVTKTVTIQ
jgi:hypothetical protein